MTLAEEFMIKTRMLDKNGEKKGVKDMIEYLSSPAVLNKMMIATELGLPVLTLVANDLERRFDENSNFPVVKVGEEYNSTNRQNIGRATKFLMQKMGCHPIAGKLDPQCRIPAAMKAEHFSTSAVYVKDSPAEYEVVVDVVRHI